MNNFTKFAVFFQTIFVFLLIGHFTLCASPVELHYTFQSIDEKQLQVILSFQGNSEGCTEIEFPLSWTGHPFQEITNLTCLSNDCPMDVEKISDQSLKIIHEPGAQLELQYCLTQQETHPQDIEGTQAPYVHDNSFFRYLFLQFSSVRPRRSIYCPRMGIDPRTFSYMEPL